MRNPLQRLLALCLVSLIVLAGCAVAEAPTAGTSEEAAPAEAAAAAAAPKRGPCDGSHSGNAAGTAAAAATTATSSSKRAFEIATRALTNKGAAGRLLSRSQKVSRKAKPSKMRKKKGKENEVKKEIVTSNAGKSQGRLK